MSQKVIIFSTQKYEYDTLPKANSKFNLDLVFRKEKLTLENIDLVAGCEAVCIETETIDKALIEKLQWIGVKVIALRSAGFNNVDLRAAEGKIKIVRVPAYSPHAIAEHAVGLMLSLNRKIHRAYWRTKDDNFSTEGLMGFNMQGKTAGVIGTGRIGKATAGILRGFGMTVLCNDVYQDEKFAKEIGVEYVDHDTLFAKSDIITLHCPLTHESEYLINKDTIAKMKDKVMIINTGRGKLIKTQDLIDAILNEKVGSAGLDVYEQEADYFNRDFSNSMIKDNTLARLLSFNNVIVTSHQAYFTIEAVTNIADTTLENIADYYAGKDLKNSVSIKDLE